ncbi:MAG TPA: hypothetical protein VF676_01765 [Flavobacterium sp.]
MDQTYIHLVITHLPIFGSMLGGLVLAYGIWFKSRSTKIAAYNVLIVSAVGGLVAYFTGESAEETAEHLEGVSEAAIHAHEEFAELTVFAIGILGALALAGLLRAWRNGASGNGFGYLVLSASLVCFAMTSYTGYLGGFIRHTEVHGGTAAANDGDEESEDEKENDNEKRGRNRRGKHN